MLFSSSKLDSDVVFDSSGDGFNSSAPDSDCEIFF